MKARLRSTAAVPPNEPTLYRKYRPQKFSEVSGQDHVVRVLSRALQGTRVAHAYLFAGPRGTGKTTVARLLAKRLNCELPKGPEPCGSCAACAAVARGMHLDLVEIDAASTNSVDDVRMLQERIRLQPAHGRWKVYIVDEVHMLSKSAANALLKTLEEPPSHAIFVLATTELDKIPETVRSRCQTFLFRRAPASLIEERLGTIARAEGLKVSPEALRLLATAAGGCFRDAESLLATVAGSSGEEVSAAEASELLGLTPVPDVQVFCTALFARDAPAALASIQRTSERGGSFSNFLETLARYLRALASFSLAGVHAESYSPDEETEFQRHAGATPVRDQVALLRLALRAKYELRDAMYEELPLELLALEWCSAPSGGEEDGPSAGRPAHAREHAAPVGKETHVALPAVLAESAAAKTSYERDGLSPTFESILRVWPQFLRAASALHALLLPMLHSAVPLAVRENTLFVLSNHALAHNRLKDATFRQPLEQKLEEITGTSLRFRLVRDGELLTLGLTERAADMRSRLAAMLGALQEPPADPAIADTLSIFGGEVVRPDRA